MSPPEINLFNELKDLNTRLAENIQSQRDLCKKFDDFLANGAPRCADRSARLKDLEDFHTIFIAGTHPICTVGKVHWQETTKKITGMNRWLAGIASGVTIAVLLMILQAFIRWPLGV